MTPVSCLSAGWRDGSLRQKGTCEKRPLPPEEESQLHLLWGSYDTVPYEPTYPRPTRE